MASRAGFEVTEGVGGTGVVALLRNGEGATVLLRADMDARPMKENTGLPYASTRTVIDPSGQEVPVAHSCGHDMHVAWLMGATRILAANDARSVPPTVNDDDSTRKVTDALRRRFGAERVHPAGVTTASEDFSHIPGARNVPSVYWIVGGTDPQKYAEARGPAGRTRSRRTTPPSSHPSSSQRCAPASRRCSRRPGAWLIPSIAR